jgi:hypothetical protein
LKTVFLVGLFTRRQQSIPRVSQARQRGDAASPCSGPDGRASHTDTVRSHPYTNGGTLDAGNKIARNRCTMPTPSTNTTRAHAETIDHRSPREPRSGVARSGSRPTQAPPIGHAIAREVSSKRRWHSCLRQPGVSTPDPGRICELRREIWAGAPQQGIEAIPVAGDMRAETTSQQGTVHAPAPPDDDLRNPTRWTPSAPPSQAPRGTRSPPPPSSATPALSGGGLGRRRGEEAGKRWATVGRLGFRPQSPGGGDAHRFSMALYHDYLHVHPIRAPVEAIFCPIWGGTGAILDMGSYNS